MPRTLALWIAFTTAGSMFALVMVFAALALGAGGGSASQASPSASTAAPSGPVGTIEVRAFDLGFEPSMVHVDTPGTYAVHRKRTHVPSVAMTQEPSTRLVED